MRVVRVLYEGDCRYGPADRDTVTLITDEPFASWEALVDSVEYGLSHPRSQA